MINVLPKKEKEALRKEYYFRFAIMCLLLLSFIILLASSLLIPSFILSKEKVSSLQSSLESFNEIYPTQTKEDFEQIVNDVNTTLSLLSKSKSTVNVSENILGLILSLRTEGITFHQIIYSEKSDTVRMVEVRGFAANRADLSKLENTIEADSRIASVDLPVSNFAKKTNIDFAMSIKMK